METHRIAVTAIPGKQDFRKQVGFAMPQPRYYFRVTRGKYAGDSNGSAFEANDDAAAWQEMLEVCSDVVGDVCRGLKEDSDWRLELLDEARKPLFRISLAAESLT